MTTYYTTGSFSSESDNETDNEEGGMGVTYISNNELQRLNKSVELWKSEAINHRNTINELRNEPNEIHELKEEMRKLKKRHIQIIMDMQKRHRGEIKINEDVIECLNQIIEENKIETKINYK